MNNTEAYIESLKQQAELNRLYAEKNQEANLQQKYNITPTPVVEETVDDMMSNTTKQREEALKNSLTLPVNKEVAVEFVSKLQPEDLVFFNQSFNDFKDKIKGFKNVDANFLDVVFDRYMKAFASNKGFPIPVEVGEVRPEQTKKGKIRSEYQKALQERTEQRIARIVPGESNRNYKESLGQLEFDARTNDRALGRNFRDRAKLQGKLVEAALEKRLATEQLAREIEDEPDPRNRRWLIEQANRRQDAIEKKYRRKVGKIEYEMQQLDNERRYDEAERNLTLEDLAFANQNAEVPYQGAPFEGMDFGELHGEYDTDPRTGERRFHEAGYGLRSKSVPLVKGLKHTRKPDPHAKFGKHFIHLPSLHEGKLVVRFPSGKGIPKFGKIPISDDLKAVVLKALETGSFDPKASRRLSESEVRKLVRVCEYCNVEHPFSVESDDKEVERFNVLRGEIQAGNDNPSIVKELKQLLLKFMAEKRISHRDAYVLMYELTSV